MEKIIIKGVQIPKGGMKFDNEKKKYVDINGNVCADELQDDDIILVFKGRRELCVFVQDEEVKEWIKEHLKTADSLFPPLKHLTTWLDKHKFEYELIDIKKGELI